MRQNSKQDSKQNSKQSSRLFFIEFIIVLFFFLIISTICIRIFAKAHQITQQANALSGAQMTCASIAGILAKEDADSEVISDLFPEAVFEDGQFSICYDKDFQAIPEPSSDDAQMVFYTLKAEISTGSSTQILMTVTDRNETVIYSLQVTVHHPMTRKEALS